MAGDPVRPARRRAQRQGAADRGPGWARWFGDPRAAVLAVLFLIVLVGGGRKLLRGWRARGVVHRLGEPDVSEAEIAAAVEFGREGLMDLFQIMGTADRGELRRAAGRALSVLWARDELIAEEEQALVRRGFEVTWKARRRYPRALQKPIPMAVSYSVPFLDDEGGGVAPANLEWSHAIVGAGHAALETPSPFRPGAGTAEFTIVPEDFATNGPHRLAIKTRVRTTGLTESWELELPQMPFSFEFDPRLSVDALFALADSGRGAAIARAVRLAPPEFDPEAGPTPFLALDSSMAVRNPPVIRIELPLPCDLAHSIHLEVEGAPGRLAAGAALLSGQGEPSRVPAAATRRDFPLLAAGEGPDAGITVERPGRYALRAILTPDPDRGWGDPEIRSIWPEPIVTDWVEVEVVRL